MMPDSTSPRSQLMRLSMGYRITQAIAVVAELSIADLLADNPKSSNELANLTHVDSKSLHRVLRALASVGIFQEDESGAFKLTPMAEYLRTDHPKSAHAHVVKTAQETYQAFSQLMYSTQTGHSAFEKIYGMKYFDYYAKYPERAEMLDIAMTNFSEAENEEIVKSFDFGKARHIVDVGGGLGSLLATILQENQHLNGTLFDQPAVVEKATAILRAKKVDNRCRVVGGNFFQEVPSSCDIYILKRILHDWNDDNAIQILQSCCRAMRPESKLIIAEQVIPPGNGLFDGKIVDLAMLVLFEGGCERTEQEYSKLLSASGLSLVKIHPTASEISLIEAKLM